jgi:SAM-dependent methyltransferase
MPADNLSDLFNHYGSDKDRNGYTPHYHSIFKHIRDRPLDILEIGIGTMIPEVHSSMVGYALPGYSPGGSLRAWRDYFPQSNVMGCDVQPDTQFSEERITTVLSDSTNKEAVEKTFGDSTFDIIIDDGSHWDENQWKTFQNFWHRTRPGGFYIIEDIYPGSKMAAEFRDRVVEVVGNRGTLFLTEKKNFMIISRKTN